jgi:uncharacterized protein (DUF2235 family)
MMRHLVVCCDGTWNSPDQDAVTNVRRLFNALDTSDHTAHKNKQVSHYVPGVGTEGDLVSKLVGGALGVGPGFGPGRSLAANVLEGYHWLITNYQDGDRIALFGFSRGAYTARSLAGLIAMCGLIDASGVDEQETWRRIKRVYRHYQVGYRYQQGRAGQDGDPHWRDGLTFRFDPVEAKKIPVHFIGVWDTVGSLGIPDPLRWLAPAFSSRRYEFNDVRLPTPTFDMLGKRWPWTNAGARSLPRCGRRSSRHRRTRPNRMSKRCGSRAATWTWAVATAKPVSATAHCSG